MQKRGAEISINVIIVAAIALVVLVVLIAIFLGRIDLFGRGIASASGKDCVNHYSVDDNGEIIGDASWQSECDKDTERKIYTPMDSINHPEEVCCVSWESGAKLQTR